MYICQCQKFACFFSTAIPVLFVNHPNNPTYLYINMLQCKNVTDYAGLFTQSLQGVRNSLAN